MAFIGEPIICASSAAQLATVNAANCFDQQRAFVTSISATAPVPGMYRFITGAVAIDGNQSQLIIVPGTNPASGQWVRCDSFIDLILPITFATADAASLVTVPANVTLKPFSPPNMFWEMTAAWTGGIGSTIGISFTNPAIGSTNGSLMGGAAGDTGFTGASIYRGTTGIVWGATPSIFGTEVVLPPTSTIKFNRITSAFTAGTGNVHAPCWLLQPIQAVVVPP